MVKKNNQKLIIYSREIIKVTYLRSEIGKLSSNGVLKWKIINFNILVETC